MEYEGKTYRVRKGSCQKCHLHDNCLQGCGLGIGTCYKEVKTKPVEVKKSCSNCGNGPFDGAACNSKPCAKDAHHEIGNWIPLEKKKQPRSFDERISDLEQRLGAPTPGTSITRTYTRTGDPEWTLALGQFHLPKQTFVGATIEDCLKRAEKECNT